MIIADTNVVSELMKPSPTPAVSDWVRARRARELFTTAITLAEIGYGIEHLPDGRRKQRIGTLAAQLFSGFADQILPFDADAAAHYAEIVTSRERTGTPIDGFDAQIASICRSRAATLATRNLKDFRHTGIELVDPWGAADAGGPLV